MAWPHLFNMFCKFIPQRLIRNQASRYFTEYFSILTVMTFLLWCMHLSHFFQNIINSICCIRDISINQVSTMWRKIYKTVKSSKWWNILKTFWRKKSKMHKLKLLNHPSIKKLKMMSYSKIILYPLPHGRVEHMTSCFDIISNLSQKADKGIFQITYNQPKNLDNK